MFQHCCYGDDGLLRTSEEFTSGSMFLYHPAYYPIDHDEADARPKELCCKLSPACDLYHEYRPMSTCVP